MPPIAPPAATPPATASRAKIVAMATIAGAVVTNIYCTQPILPLIAQDLHVAPATADLVAGAALLGFATGLALLLPLGDRYDRRKLVLGQIVLAFAFAVASALAPGVWALIGAAFSLGVVSCVPQQLVPFAAVMSAPNERGRNVGTVVTGIMVGILLGRAVSGLIAAHAGWRAVYAVEAAAMVPVGIAAAWLLPRGVPAPRCRMAGCSRRSGRWPARIARSANRWSCRRCCGPPSMRSGSISRRCWPTARGISAARGPAASASSARQARWPPRSAAGRRTGSARAA